MIAGQATQPGTHAQTRGTEALDDTYTSTITVRVMDIWSNGSKYSPAQQDVAVKIAAIKAATVFFMAARPEIKREHYSS